MGIRIAVATVLEDLGVWQLIPPRLYEAFLDATTNPFPPDGRKDSGLRIRPLSDRNGWDNAVETWVGARR
jgi:hypothetical protein